MNEHENNRLNKVLECEGCDDYMIIDNYSVLLDWELEMV